jgi:acetyl/propionyl-CoA carboxylase alpha subunit
VRGMTRADDMVYLERLVQESRHIEVKKAAESQIRLLAELLARRQQPKN